MATVGGGAGCVADGVSEVTQVKWLDKAKADNEAYRLEVIEDAQTRVVIGNRARMIGLLVREAYTARLCPVPRTRT
jgi:hypothetical protein